MPNATIWCPRGARPTSRRTIGRRSPAGRGPLALLALGVALFVVACGDDGLPSSPSAPMVGLENDELLSGGTGVVGGEDLAQIENFSVRIAGDEVDSRRIAPDRIEFDVPVLPGGSYDVQTSVEGHHATTTASVLGVVASGRVNDDCSWNTPIHLLPDGDRLIFGSACWQDGEGQDTREGYAAVRPALPEAGMTWLPGLYGDEDEESLEDEDRNVIQAGPSIRPGHFLAKRRGPDAMAPDVWVWRSGEVPEPVAALPCFTVDVPSGTATHHLSIVAEPSEGTCLAFNQHGQVFRNGEPLLELEDDGRLPGFDLAPDGWTALHSLEQVAVFDPQGNVVHVLEGRAGTSRPTDAAFSDDGQRMYVAWRLSQQSAGAAVTVLEVIDRTAGASIRETEVEGDVWALRVSADRLWTIRTIDDASTGVGGQLRVDLHDAETLDRQRSVAVADDLLDPVSRVNPPGLGPSPVILEDDTGTRVHVAGWIEDRVGVHAHVVEVF